MVARSRRHHSPVIELGLLRSRTFSGAFTASILYYAGFGAFVLASVEFRSDGGPLAASPLARDRTGAAALKDLQRCLYRVHPLLRRIRRLRAGLRRVQIGWWPARGVTTRP